MNNQNQFTLLQARHAAYPCILYVKRWFIMEDVHRLLLYCVVCFFYYFCCCFSNVDVIIFVMYTHNVHYVLFYVYFEARTMSSHGYTIAHMNDKRLYSHSYLKASDLVKEDCSLWRYTTQVYVWQRGIHIHKKNTKQKYHHRLIGTQNILLEVTIDRH